MGILNVKALRDWILLRGVNHMLATEKGFFMDARLGPVIQGELDKLKANVGEINSNLANFGIISASQNIDLAADELKIVGLTHQAVPKDAVIASAMVSVNNTFMQATLRNVTNSAANIMVKNHKPGANSGTVYFTVFYMPAP